MFSSLVKGSPIARHRTMTSSESLDEREVRAVAFTMSTFIQCLLNSCWTHGSELVKIAIIHVGVVGGEFCADSKFFTL